MSKVEIKETKLVWPEKYDEDGKLIPVERAGPYPFQIVEAINSPRISKRGGENLTLFDYWSGEEKDTFEEGWKNKLIWGDNKLVMSSLLKNFAGKINLIYIDPPFATGADFKFKILIGEEKDQVVKEHSILEEKAYRDTWGKGLNSYLQMMYERLILMRDLLAENGSIYVHLDWHVGHYVKVMMDEIFGYGGDDGKPGFRNEISWAYRTGGAPGKGAEFPKKHDIILLYSKGANPKFKKLKERVYYEKPFFTSLRDSNGRYYADVILRDVLQDEILLVLEDSKLLRLNVKPVINVSKENLNFLTQKPEGLLQILIMATTNPGDLVADFFCGSGTTLAVAEKLGRRWIGCDLSRYAIHLTRKRLLDIEKSKDLINGGIYGKKAQPFELLNLGKYERQYWQTKTFNKEDTKQRLYEYIAFMLKLYGAEPISGFTTIHGKKSNALVYVGPVDAPVTIFDVTEAIKDCKASGQKELHVLGWEWEMGLNDAIQDIAKAEGINLKLRIIPNDVLDNKAVEKGDIRFFELAYFKTDINVTDNKKITVELKDFVIPHTDLIPQEAKDAIKKWTDWIDYWAIDFDFQNDTFNNGWVSYRTNKDRTLTLKAEHIYDKPGKYKVFVKVIDIFGIDTSQVYEVDVK